MSLLRLRWAKVVLAIALMLAAIGIWIATISPPAQLSLLDGWMGGGSGTSIAGDALPFGTHGQTLDVWRPAAAKASDKRPVLIFFYGGGWVKGDRRAYAFAARPFAKSGYVVVVPDYRKVPDVRFPAFLQDGAEAVKWVRDHIAEFGGDPSRIAIAGHSAGSYTVAMLALDPRWLKAEGVDPGIIKGAIGLSGPYDFYPFTGRAVEAFAGAADPAMTQPINFARADAPPMLLVTSSGDTTVRPKNAINLDAKLRAVGARVTLKNYPGLSHEEVVMALSVPFRKKGPTLADSLSFLEGTIGKPR